MNSIPKPYLIIYLILSAVLNILGIASLVDGVVSWAGFAAQIITTYRAYFREPILHFLIFFWPSGWPRIPGWVIDILVIQSSFFISYRLFMSFEKRKFGNVFKELKISKHGIFYFIGGPIVPFFQLLQVVRIARREIQMARGEAIIGQAAQKQIQRYGSSNLPVLSGEGWRALDKRQLAGLQALDAAKTTFFKLNLYYACYLALVIVILFVAYQIDHIRS
jgi:hypothetical protein